MPRAKNVETKITIQVTFTVDQARPDLKFLENTVRGSFRDVAMVHQDLPITARVTEKTTKTRY